MGDISCGPQKNLIITCAIAKFGIGAFAALKDSHQKSAAYSLVAACANHMGIRAGAGGLDVTVCAAIWENHLKQPLAQWPRSALLSMGKNLPSVLGSDKIAKIAQHRKEMQGVFGDNGCVGKFWTPLADWHLAMSQCGLTSNEQYLECWGADNKVCWFSGLMCN